MDAVKELYDRQVRALNTAERIRLAHLIMADLDHGVSSDPAHSATIAGTPLSELLRFSGSIADEDAEEMMQAIEEGCEQIDVDEW
jgi:hypothetical protein